MKKIISLVIAALLVMSLTIVAFAANGETNGNSINDRAIQAQQRLDERKAQICEMKENREAFRTAAQEMRDFAQAARDENKAICNENAELREQLTDALLALQESGTILDPALVDQLNVYDTSLKELTATLSETKGGIHAQIGKNRGFVKEQDYEGMEQAFSDVGTIQSERNAILLQINDILKQMLELLK